LLFEIDRHDAVKLAGVVFGSLVLASGNVDHFLGVQIGDDTAAEPRARAGRSRHVIGDAGFFRMHVGATGALRQ